MEIKKEETPKEKTLLALLPFWDPQIPSLGIGCLKSYLQGHGYQVKAVDANIDVQFRELYDTYYKILREIVPQERQGNIFNIGNQVLRNHLMAYLNAGEHESGKYTELVQILVKKTFFTNISREHITALDEILKTFYTRLKKYVLELLEKEKPRVLGLTVYGDTFPASLAAFKWAKEKDPTIKTVMGGGIFSDQLAPGSPNLEYFEEYSKDIIDKIIVGEGEQLFLMYLEGELDETKRVARLKDIAGKTMDMSKVEVPDFSEFNLRYYPLLAHYGARSCPFQCKFCSETINWGKYRKKSVQQTRKELVELHSKHSYQLYLLTDSTLNPIITDLSNEFIESGATIYWDGFLRADKHVCKTENTMLWRRGGFYRAKLGLESGSQRVLDLMDKCITLEQSQAALTALAYAGIKTTTFWLFGFPGETEDDFLQTLEFIEKNKDTIYEADCNAFNYYLTGQANSEEWQKNNKGVLLYPEWAKEILVTQTWILDCEPTREDAYDRVNRFVEHCAKLGIPNPYSLSDVYKADERWKKLHKNAVPAIVDLKNEDLYFEETKNVKELDFAENKLDDDDDWDL
ncbi:MAG: radical SAM protein [bacterium]|nr:radical SAM protein [bacterium]